MERKRPEWFCGNGSGLGEMGENWRNNTNLYKTKKVLTLYKIFDNIDLSEGDREKSEEGAKMEITVSYRDYANRMGKSFRKVAYNQDTKQITIDLSTGGVDFDQCYNVLAMDDDALLAMLRANNADATMDEVHTAIEDTINYMLGEYHNDGYKGVTADAIKAAVEYIKK